MKSFAVALSISLFLSGFVMLKSSRGVASNDPLLIIANKAVPQNSITAAEAKQIFLKQRDHWKGGGKIVPMNTKPGTAERKAFQSKVLGMDDTAEKSYWQEQKVKKGLSPPPEFSNVQKAVFSLKGGIGYCFKSQFKVGTNKILLTL